MPDDGGLRVLVNPRELDAEIGADFLSRCFGTPWTEAMYRWYLRRAFAGEAPDRLILMDGERVVAGCGLSYRLLRTPDGRVHPVSVVVTAGTLPAERGRGCYARVLQAAVARSALRGCTALLGFVTADNATGRGLRRLGATEVASAYVVTRGRLRDPGTAALRICRATVTDRWPARAAAHRQEPPPCAAFHYPDAGSWASQMVDRPNPVEPLRIGSTCRALVECASRTDRLQWLDGDPRERVAAIHALAARAQRRRRRFFMFSTRPDDIEPLRRLGLGALPGYFMALAPEARHEPSVKSWGALSWDIQSGDRM